MSRPQEVDVIVVGSGQGGVPFAVEMARAGKRVVLFERGRLGGSCVNYGCTPSKAFLAAAHGAGRARALAPLGVRVSCDVDFSAVMARVRTIRDEFEAGVASRLAEAGVRVIAGSAAFTSLRTLAAGEVEVTAPLVVINTGTGPRVPPVEGLAAIPFLTNETFFDLTALPRRTLVLGGGYIGLELGQGLARLGSEVHIVDANARVLAREEADASAALQEGLRRDGVRLHLGRTVTRISRAGEGFSAMLDSGDEVHADVVLVAVGRRPNTETLDAGRGGVALTRAGYIAIDDQFRTSAPGTFAIGDVAGQPAFTHVSWEDYRRLTAILRGEARTRSDRVLAYATYTEPQVARVGLDQAQAAAQGCNARVLTLPLTSIARAQEWGYDVGFFRLVVEMGTDRILGATLVGYETAELIHVILAHMEAGSTWRVLERSVHVHPTYAEGLPTLARQACT
jgi:pyruvate/2-oxoglutarate dehydrogenase complex dihydrolipoamide dehydrogenase (E3) component